MSNSSHARASRTPTRLATICATTIIICAAHPLHAQGGTGGVNGIITDSNHRPLAGALVQIANNAAETSAGRDGIFRIFNVTAGSQKLVIRYIGYQPETLTVDVTRGQMKQADVEMKHPVQELEAIKVESSVAGQAAALNQQRTAENVSSVVDAELVGRLPDRNLAEALGRVPGVALVRDQGEGRFVQIRGTSATLNTLSIDGMRMPSPDPSTRQTPMDVIPSDMVSAIQVSKTLTSDMDGDAIGGNVNLVTPTARRGMPLVAINAAGGENKINNGGMKNFSAQLGRRLGANEKLGVILGGNYYQNDRGSQNYEMGWCVENVGSSPCKGVPTASALDAPTQIALRNYSQVLRTRQGGNATLDYRFNDNNSLFFKGLYSKFSDSEQRYVTTPSFSSGTYTLTDANHGTVTGGRMDKELRLRPVSQVQQSVQIGGKNLLGQSTQLDYTLQVARAREDRPRSLTMVFRQSAMDFTYDVSDENQPKFTVTKGAELDASKFVYNTLRQQTRHGLDDDKSGRINISHPFEIGNTTALFKAGFSARLKDRSSRDTSNRFLATFKAGAAVPTLPLTIAAFPGSPRTNNFLDGKYVFGPQADALAVQNFWTQYGGSLNTNAAQSQVESTQGSYDLTENVYAGYLMATLDVGPLHIIPGVRVESTHENDIGNFVSLTGTNVTVTPITHTKDYSNVLPSITARFTMDERTVVRGAITSSLVRPQFTDFAPTTNVPDGAGVTATIGNPELKPITATNFDLMVEHYLGSVGFISVGVFHKSLSDYIFAVTRAPIASDNVPSTVSIVSQPQNAQSGKLDGVEVAWQQNLTMLPGLLSGLGLNVNYTRTNSSTTLPSREGVKARLPGQAGNAGNLGLFYERSRLSLRAGYNYADKYLEVVGATTQTDIYVASRAQLDVSGSLQLNRQAKLFMETNNLTNQPLRRYEGQSARSWQPGNEYYRSWGMAGIRIQY